MIKILFVCHGNICRSASAEYMFKYMISKHHLEHKLYCGSAGVSNEEAGNDIYPPMKPYLIKRKIPLSRHYAHKITMQDYLNFDLILAFDNSNMNYLNYMFKDEQHKIHLLNEYVGLSGEIDDPWYAHDFDRALDQIELSLNLLLRKLTNQH